MVEISVSYLGELRCEAVHVPSGARLITDAPADNMGKAQSFSPTDLIATALLSCIFTTMGIVADRNAVDLSGAHGRVTKTMTTEGPRRIARLGVTIALPHDLPEEQKRLMEDTARSCPVHLLLGQSVEIPLEFRWGAEAGVAQKA